jgi:hypothetical protein
MRVTRRPSLYQLSSASDYVIMLSISLEYTTYTTITQLGKGHLTATGQAAAPMPQSTTPSIKPIVLNNSNISGGDIAAIVGTILGVLIALCLYCICKRGNRGLRGVLGRTREPGEPGPCSQDRANGRDVIPWPRGLRNENVETKFFRGMPCLLQPSKSATNLESIK